MYAEPFVYILNGEYMYISFSSYSIKIKLSNACIIPSWYTIFLMHDNFSYNKLSNFAEIYAFICSYSLLFPGY